jgi:phage/plasmid primase-like uncharacterized protein
LFQNVSLKTIEQFAIRTNDAKSVLYIPLHNNEGQKMGFKILKINVDGEETIPTVGCGGVICFHHGKNVKENAAVIVHGVADALALASCKTNHQVVCLPYGGCYAFTFIQLPVYEIFLS